MKAQSMQAKTLFCAAGVVLCAGAHAADRLTVTVTHDLDAARPSETIAIPWQDVNAALPGALIQHLVVKDAAGHVLPYQVTNVAPQAKDPKGIGAAYGELLFQHDFRPGEKSATFVVEKNDALTPPFAPKAFARYVPERLDDFAWENDVVGHRTYGPALAAPAPPGSGKEVLETSGLDIWFKGEGMDMYNVGRSRGAGGTGVWDGKQLYTSGNWAGWKMLANGPIRAVFELSYTAWNAGGTQVTETKRFTVDAGHQLDRIDSTFTFSGPAALTVAVGLNKTPSDKKQEPRIALVKDEANRALLQWVEQASNGAFGTAVVLPASTGFAEDALNDLVLARVESGKPLRYWVGAAWDRAGRVTSRAAWQAYVAAEAKRAAHPVHIALDAGAN